MRICRVVSVTRAFCGSGKGEEQAGHSVFGTVGLKWGVVKK